MTVKRKSDASAADAIEPCDEPPVVRSKVPALSRGIEIVRHINESADPIGVTEIARRLGVGKSACFNILRTMQDEKWVEFDARTKRYSLSTGLLTDISSLLSRPARSAQMHQVLVDLSVSARLPCVLTRIEADGTFIAIDKAEGSSELTVSVQLGHRFPSNAPAQMRAHLAWATPTVRAYALDRWKPVAHTSRTIMDRNRLEAEIEKTRERGYSISRVEFTPGVMTLAAPVLDVGGHPTLILQCPGLEQDVAPRERKIASLLVEAAGRISEIIQRAR
jgi:DNA-binding IclR family transcriptional regulator